MPPGRTYSRLPTNFCSSTAVSHAIKRGLRVQLRDGSADQTTWIVEPYVFRKVTLERDAIRLGVVKRDSGEKTGCAALSAHSMISRMAKSTVQQIKSLARSVIARNPGGIRYAALVAMISEQSPETPKGRFMDPFGTWTLFSRTRSLGRAEVSPNMFYVNGFADRLKHHDAEIFEELSD